MMVGHNDLHQDEREHEIQISQMGSVLWMRIMLDNAFSSSRA